MRTLLLLLCLCLPAFATDRFVSPSGNNGNTGLSWTQAKLPSGMGSANPDDTIWMAAGTYGGFTMPCSGTSGHPITWRRATVGDSAATSAAGWSSGMDGQIICGTIQYLNGTGGYTVIDGRNTTWGTYQTYGTNGGYGIRIPFGDQGAAVVFDRSANYPQATLTNVECVGPMDVNFSHSESGATTAVGSSGGGNGDAGIVLTHCSVHGCDTLFQVYGSSQIVEYSIFHTSGDADTANDKHPNCIYAAGFSNNTYRYNIFTNYIGEGILWGFSIGSNNKIYGNIFWATGGGGSKGLDFTEPTSGGSAFVYNNTFGNMGSPALHENYPLTGAGTITIKNNIYWNVGQPENVTGTTYSYNFYSGGSSGGAGEIANGSNPFVNVGTDFHIISSVGAKYPRDKGTSLGSEYNTDPDGHTRGSDGSWDIGAYEYGISDPGISSQPTNVTIFAGQAATFSVTASGTPGFTYQWRTNGVAVPGASASSYTKGNCQVSDSGIAYWCAVTNSIGWIYSAQATLTVNPDPGITIQPQGQTVTAGQTASFSVTATGAPASLPLTYQWTTNGVNISGATSSSYTTPATVVSDDGKLFAVVVTDGNGSITSSNAILNVNSTPPPVVNGLHYIIQGGVGSGAGTSWTNAMSDLPATFVRGDTYYIGVGTYTNHTLGQAATGTTNIYIKRATQTDHGDSAGWNAPWGLNQAILGQLTITTPYWIIDGQVRDTNTWTAGYGIALSASNVRIVDMNNDTAHDITFRYVEFSGGGLGDGVTGSALFTPTSGPNIARNVTMQYCYTHGVWPNPLALWGKTYLFEYNFFDQNKNVTADPNLHGNVIELNLCSSVTARYNRFRNGEGTAHFTWIGFSGTVTNIQVYGNVAWQTPSYAGGGVSAFFEVISNTAASNVSVHHNTLYNVGWYPRIESDMVGTGLNAYNNMWINCQDTTGGNTHFNVDYSYYAGTTHSAETHSVDGSDPTVNSSAYNFHLAQATTPPGLALPSPYNIDPDGVTRAHPDRGAFEFVSTGTAPSITSQPVSKTNSVTGSALFSVTATGDLPINYQWYLAGSAIGTNGPSFGITNLSLSNTGAVYVAVSNAFGGLVSSTVYLQVTNTTGAHTFYVATNGNDANNGLTTTFPLRTVSMATRLVQYGDTVLIRNGVFRENITTPQQPTNSGSSSNMIAFRSYPGEFPVISGATNITGSWTLVASPLIYTAKYPSSTNNNSIANDQIVGSAAGTVWSISWPYRAQNLFYITNGVRTALQQLGWSGTNYDWVWSGGPVTWTKNDIRPSTILTNWQSDSFFWCATNNTLYARFATGHAPTNSGVTIETGATKPFYLGWDYLNVSNITFQCSKSSDTLTIFPGVNLHSGCTISGCTIEWMDLNGLFVWTNSIVTNCIIRNNGCVGMNAGATFQLRNSLISSNNARLFPTSFGSGGVKIITAQIGIHPDFGGSIVSDNTFIGNNGYTLWFDTVDHLASGNIHIYKNTIAYSSSQNNSPGIGSAGIYLEWCGGIGGGEFQIDNNLLLTNDTWGIFFNNTSSAKAQLNTIVTDGQNGAFAFTASHDGPTPTNNAFANNIVYQTANWSALSIQTGISNDASGFHNMRTNNVINNNLYFVGLGALDTRCPDDPNITAGTNCTYGEVFSTYTNAVAPYWDTTSIAADPLFGVGLIPSSSSPVVSKYLSGPLNGISLFTTTTDYLGLNRRNPTSLGAYSVNGGWGTQMSGLQLTRGFAR